jgi:hypothetical protein
VLKDNGFEGAASLELTKGMDGKPNNCVHFHIITDDQRDEEDLRKLLEKACERQGLVKGKNFCITYKDLWDGESYFYYFTKYGEKYFHEVILFQPKLLKSGKNSRTLQKFYEIGHWFNEGKGVIWDKIKAYYEEKNGRNIEETGNCDNLDIPEIDDEIATEPVQEEAHNSDDIQQETLDKFVSLKCGDGYIHVDKRLLVDNLYDYPDCLPSLSVMDQRHDWDRYRYSVAFIN